MTYYAYVEYPTAGRDLADYRNVVCVEQVEDDNPPPVERHVLVKRVDGRRWVNETRTGARGSFHRLARPEQLVSTWPEYTRAVTEAQVADQEREQREAEDRAQIEDALLYFEEVPASSAEFEDLADKLRRYLLTGGVKTVTLTADEVVAVARRLKEMEAIIHQNALVAIPETEEDPDATT